MNIKQAFYCLLLALPFQFAVAQVPDTEIFLLDMQKKGSSYTFGQPLNISQNEGYDNQPAFSADGTYLLYTSMRDGRQTDIYQYICKSGATRQISDTEESEYSPTFIPGENNFSTVQVEADSTQRLWVFPLQGGAGKVILPDTDSIGYHCWINKDQLALAIITEPMSLVIANRKDGSTYLKSKNAGRALVPLNKAVLGFYYINKNDSTAEGYMIVRYTDGKIQNLARTLGSSEDFCLMPDGSLLMGKGGKLYALDPAGDKTWEIIADLSTTEVKDFYRLAVSPKGDRIAVVSFKGKRP